MSSNYLSQLLLGGFVTVLVVVLLVTVARWMRNYYFPKENPEEDSEAMMEVLRLKAKLEKRATEDEGFDGGRGGTPEWEPDEGSGWRGPEA